jgi:RNA polymerase sigma-70 factor (ECF subfamily)
MSVETKPRTNEEWLRSLRAQAPEALEELRRILIRGLQAALSYKVNGDLEPLAEDFAQEALLKVLNNLDTFRGESRFTTWAQKIAVHIALSELRRRRWRDVPLQTFTQSSEGEELTPSLLTDPEPQPEQVAARNDLLHTVEDLIFDELTERQRAALLALVQDGDQPLRDLAKRLHTNPNALYKLIHDARQRMRERLEEKTGMSAQELLTAFERG